MHLDGLLGDEQLLGDFAVREVACGQRGARRV
jgi:hypothetical protein